jgi:hypothetical protein
LESGTGFMIDKKTLKRIVERLCREKLLKTSEFLVTLEAVSTNNVQKFVKTLVLDPELNERDAQLMQNPTLANPTNRVVDSKAKIKSEDDI